MSESIVIVGAARTPMGGFQGDFASLSAHDLGGVAIKAAVERAGIAPDTVGEVLFEQHLAHGVGRDARALDGGLDGDAAEVVRGKGGEIALEAAHGGAGGADDDDGFGHGGLLRKCESGIGKETRGQKCVACPSCLKRCDSS